MYPPPAAAEVIVVIRTSVYTLIELSGFSIFAWETTIKKETSIIKTDGDMTLLKNIKIRPKKIAPKTSKH